MAKTASSFYDEANVPASNWMKFDSVGDSVNGTFKEQFFKEWSWVMPDQEVFVLTNASLDKVECDDNGNILKLASSEPIDWDINVAIKVSNSYILTRLKNVKPWDIIWFAFTQEIAPKQKWYNAAKSIKPFKVWVDEEFLKNFKYPAEQNENISESDIPF